MLLFRWALVTPLLLAGAVRIASAQPLNETQVAAQVFQQANEFRASQNLPQVSVNRILLETADALKALKIGNLSSWLRMKSPCPPTGLPVSGSLGPTSLYLKPRIVVSPPAKKRSLTGMSREVKSPARTHEAQMTPRPMFLK